jgi:plasmid stability protein
MASLLIRNLDPAIVESLKVSAKEHGRSLQAEAAAILADVTAMRHLTVKFAEWSDAVRERIARRGILQPDSADLIREDRDSDHGRDW